MPSPPTSALRLCLITLLATVAPRASAQESTSHSVSVRVTAAELRTVETQVLELVNTERRRAGLADVVASPMLDAVAAYHSTNMALQGFFSHDDHLGEDPKSRLKRLHPALVSNVSENIAYLSGYAQDTWAHEFMHRLMNSPGHRANILTAWHTHLGLGVVHVAADDAVYLTQNFGTLIAARETSDAALECHVGQTVTMIFQYLGRFDTSDITAVILIPDSTGHPQEPRGGFLVGATQLSVRWLGSDRFAVELAIGQQPGEYLLALGWSNRYPTDGRISIQVRRSAQQVIG